MNQSRPWVSDVVSLAIIFALLAAVSLLPPDTSLAEVKRTGILKACVPTSYPPLVTGTPDEPGIDVELLRMVADHLGVRLSLNTNPSMGRDFNPRNWGVTRAQCEILAGGVIVSDLTRSFLDTTPPYLNTGWALVTPDDLASLDGATVGVFVGLSGFDRIALSSLLRGEGARLAVVPSRDELAARIADGRLQAGVTEALTARQLAGERGWKVRWLSGTLDTYPIAFGLWKGDLTLKRAVTSALDDLRAEGAFRTVADHYTIAPIDDSSTPG